MYVSRLETVHINFELTKLKQLEFDLDLYTQRPTCDYLLSRQSFQIENSYFRVNPYLSENFYDDEVVIYLYSKFNFESRTWSSSPRAMKIGIFRSLSFLMILACAFNIEIAIIIVIPP